MKTIQRIVGFLIAGSSVMMVPPVLVSLWYQDGTVHLFLFSAAVLLLTGLLTYFPVKNEKKELRFHDGFLIVVASWLVLALVGALPFVLLPSPRLSYIDSVFESMSALTTTGATILSNIDALPKGLLYYRQQLQWFGGMGIIVLAVAILPMLRIGGMQLYRAETPGPMKETKLTPRVTETAKALWLIYVGLTAGCALAYWLGGMSLFDAIGHSYTTVSTGGLSTHDSSVSFWDNPILEVIAMFFMAISGINFALHFTAWRKASFSAYFNDPELKAYVLLLLGFSVIVSGVLYERGLFPTIGESIRYGTFQVVSVMTSTGFTTASFYLWPGSIPVLLIFIAFIGGCGGSTAGGMKVIRVLLLYRQTLRELFRLAVPRAVFNINVGRQQIAQRVVDAIWGFLILYIVSFAVMTAALAATGLDMLTAYSTVASCITNLGPALGEAGVHYGSLNDTAKIILIFSMLLGRLEIYPVIVLLMPAFWRD